MSGGRVCRNRITRPQKRLDRYRPPSYDACSRRHAGRPARRRAMYRIVPSLPASSRCACRLCRRGRPLSRASGPHPRGANAGGGTDSSRACSRKVRRRSQPAVRGREPARSSNTIAADATAKSPPDGHTLLVATNTGQAIAPHLMKLGFDPQQGSPARGARRRRAQRAGGRRSQPFTSVKELVAAAEGQSRRIQVRVLRRRQHPASSRAKRSTHCRGPNRFTCRTKAAHKRMSNPVRRGPDRCSTRRRRRWVRSRGKVWRLR